MKKDNLFKVSLFMIALVFIFTWIFKVGTIDMYTTQAYAEYDRQQLGIIPFFNYFIDVFSYFGDVLLFILCVGGFYGVLYKIPAYRVMLDKIVAKLKGKEFVFLAIVMVLIAAFASITKLSVGLLLFCPFIISLVLLMGYDKIVAALTVVGSITVGMAGASYAFVGDENLTQALTQYLQLDPTYQIGVRFVILAVGLVLLILNTFLYVRKSQTVKGDKMPMETKTVKKVEAEVVELKEEVKKSTSKKGATGTKKTASGTKKTTSGAKKSTSKTTKGSSTTKGKSTAKGKAKSSKNPNKAAAKDEDIIVVKEVLVSANEEHLVPTIVDSKHKILPMAIVLIIMVLLIAMSFISWGEGGFGVKVFTKFATTLNEVEISGFRVFGKIFGEVNAFGAAIWNLYHLVFFMMLIITLLAFIYRIKFNDVIDAFFEGVKTAVKPAALAFLAYLCLVIVTYHPFQGFIVHNILEAADGFNIALTTIVAFIGSAFNVSFFYNIANVMPIYVDAITNSANYAIVGIIFQSIYGLAMLVVPTSVVLMATLSYLGINYFEWLKKIWKLFVEFLVVLLIIFVILALI